MSESLCVRDVHPWFQDVMLLDIVGSGMLFFSNIGMCDEGLEPFLSERDGRRFTYALLPDGRLLNTLDRSYMESIRSASLLFYLGSDSFAAWPRKAIAVFSVDLDCSRSSRAYEAYGVHRLIAKIVGTDSVVLFRSGEGVMLSLQSDFESGHRIVTSDWIEPDSLSCNALERMHVANCVFDSPYLFMDSLACTSASDHFLEPLLSVRERCRLIRDDMGGGFAVDPRFLTVSELMDEALESFDEHIRSLGDDCLLIKGELFGEGEIDEEDELQWFLSEFEDEDSSGERGVSLVADEGEDEASDEEEVDAIDYAALPKEVYDDPIALLKALESMLS